MSHVTLLFLCVCLVTSAWGLGLTFSPPASGSYGSPSLGKLLPVWILRDLCHWCWWSRPQPVTCPLLRLYFLLQSAAKKKRKKKHICEPPGGAKQGPGPGQEYNVSCHVLWDWPPDYLGVKDPPGPRGSPDAHMRDKGCSLPWAASARTWATIHHRNGRARDPFRTRTTQGSGSETPVHFLTLLYPSNNDASF